MTDEKIEPELIKFQKADFIAGNNEHFVKTQIVSLKFPAPQKLSVNLWCDEYSMFMA